MSAHILDSPDERTKIYHSVITALQHTAMSPLVKALTPLHNELLNVGGDLQKLYVYYEERLGDKK